VSSAVAAVLAINLVSCTAIGVPVPASASSLSQPTDLATAASAAIDPSPSGSGVVGSADPDRSQLQTSAVATPKVDAEPTRVVVGGLGIDLPIVRPSPGETYPLCDVAEFLPEFGLPGLPGVTYIYAHAQAGMFLPLLEASRTRTAALVGVAVDVYTADSFRRRYEITDIHRHLRSFDVVNGLPGDALVLQTSETDHHTGTKLMLVARPRSEPEQVSANEARPKARPRACGD
jgi:hypothetical protein